MDGGRQHEHVARARDADRVEADTYAELCLPGLEEIVREQLPPRRGGRPRRPTGVELEIFAALWSHGFLFADQIWRRWWPERTRRWAYHALKQMTLTGWLDRYRLMLADGGSQQRFYALAEPGFNLGRGRQLRERQGIPRDARWRRLVVDRTGGLPRELHVNGWALALEQLAGELMIGWRGPFESRLLPPRRRERGEWVELRPSEIVLGTNHRLTGYQANVLEPVSPDATMDLQLPDDKSVELMIEYLREGDDPFEIEERLRRYDLFVSGWAHLLKRYRTPARAPIIVFACADERTLARTAEAADRALTTRIAKAGTLDRDWPFPGRQAILFASEPEIHRGSLRALAVPVNAPRVRAKPSRERSAPSACRHVHIIDPRVLLERPATRTMRPRRSSLR